MDTGHVYAMKILRKSDMLEKEQVWGERREGREEKRGAVGREGGRKGGEEGPEKVSFSFIFPRLHMPELSGTSWWRQTIPGW